MHITFWRLMFIALFTAATSASWAGVGKVIIAKGETYAIDASNQYWELKRRSVIKLGDTLTTGGNSELHIRFNDNAILALRADSQMKITQYSGGQQQPDRVVMQLLSGGFRTVTGHFGKSDRQAYQIKTPNASIGVRGTNYEALLNPNGQLLVGVYQGGIWLQNNTGEMVLGRDSSFSFATIDSANAIAKGLLEAPAELSKPLSTSFERVSPDSAEESATNEGELTAGDDSLSIDQLFLDNTDNAAAATTANETIIASQNLNTITTDVEDSITTLANVADLRLTLSELATLKDGSANAGFIVNTGTPTSHQIASYQLDSFSAYSGLSSTETVTFDISLNGTTYSIELNEPITDLASLVAELNAQIVASAGALGASDNQLAIPALIHATANDSGDALVLQGFSNGDDLSILIDNFSGTAAAEVAAALGLCSASAATCNGSYQAGTATSGGYQTNMQFGYLINPGSNPVLAGYDGSIDALTHSYSEPESVLKGNTNAELTLFDSVNTLTDGNQNLIEWGYWAVSDGAPAMEYLDAHDLGNNNRITTDPYFFVSAPPAPVTDLVGEYTLSDLAAWHFTTSDSNQLYHHSDTGIASLEASLAVNFDTAKATGSIVAADQNNAWSWSLNYYGSVNGAQFQSSYGWGSYSTNSESQIAVGHVNGLFTPVTDSLGFVGGFGLQTTDGSASAQGVFYLK